MPTTPPLASVPVSFFDARTGLSAFAVQHLRTDGRTAVVFHDAPGPAAARPLLSAVAGALMAQLEAGQSLILVETSMPEHPAETFVYAHVVITRVPRRPMTGSRDAVAVRVSAHATRVLAAEAVAGLCGITVQELRRTEELAAAIHRPRSCAFPGIRQLALDTREPALSVVA